MTGGLQLSVGPKRTEPAADWRLPPYEVIPPGSVYRDTLWQRILAWLFLLIGTATWVVFISRELDPGEYFITWLKSFGMIIISQLIIIYLVNRMGNYVSRGTGLKRIKTKVPNDIACPAAIKIRQDHTVTGADEGYLWFEGGTLFYKGLQAVFRVNSENLTPLDETPRGDRPVKGSGKQIRRVHLMGGKRHLTLDINLIDPFEDYHARRRANTFQASLARWIAERPDAEIETVLPPLEVHPELMRTDKLRYEGVAAGAALVVINCILLFSMLRISFDIRQLPALLAIFSLGILAVLFYHSVKFAWQQHLDQIQRRAIFLETQLSSPLEV